MAGKVIVPDIGISTDSICEDQEIVRTAGKDIYRKMLPDRPEDSNKGTYGRLLVIAGSKGMAGAAYLNAHAAYMTGAGLVRIYTSSDNREILQTLLRKQLSQHMRNIIKKNCYHFLHGQMVFVSVRALE